jgi:hypothetical protein
MRDVLCLADDECIRLTFADVLKQRGFRAWSGPLSAPARPAFEADEDTPDAIVLWQATRENAAEIRAASGEAHVLVCTWDGREPWPRGITVVPLPFNLDRLVRLIAGAPGEIEPPVTERPRRAAALATCAQRSELKVLLLDALREGPSYGTQLVRRVHARTGGAVRLHVSRVYEALRGLVRDGAIERCARDAPLAVISRGSRRILPSCYRLAQESGCATEARDPSHMAR